MAGPDVLAGEVRNSQVRPAVNLDGPQKAGRAIVHGQLARCTSPPHLAYLPACSRRSGLATQRLNAEQMYEEAPSGATSWPCKDALGGMTTLPTAIGMKPGGHTGMVGRGGLEPPTSALSARRSAS